tara:strand:+ start:177 stop:1130 length:954 start_codon:yes stop_codon:yes gene_type:complete
MKKNVLNTLMILLSITGTIAILEFFLMIKSKFIIDYDTEMWRYSKTLKAKHPNPKINHIHKKNSEATLQKVKISLNRLGLRGNNQDLNEWNNSNKKILFLGSSITLGWGVEKDKVLTSLIENRANNLNMNWKFLNAGVGNYNTERYVNNYFENLINLEPNVIIVQYFLNDAEKLPNNSGNFFTRNFHLGILIWKYMSIKSDNIKFKNIYDYYKNVYQNDKLLDVQKNLQKLKTHCKELGIRCIIVYTPDIQFIKDERFDEFENKIKLIANQEKYEFLSLTKNIRKYSDQNLVNKYNDNHPNALGHKIMAETIFEYLK